MPVNLKNSFPFSKFEQTIKIKEKLAVNSSFLSLTDLGLITSEERLPRCLQGDKVNATYRVSFSSKQRKHTQASMNVFKCFHVH